MPKMLTSDQACAYLEITSADLGALHEQGLVTCTIRDDCSMYSHTSLEIVSNLLKVGRKRNWNILTLAWYADLLFATEIGRAILLPMHNEVESADQLVNWLDSPYAGAILNDFDEEAEHTDGMLVALLRSLVAATVGDTLFWPDKGNIQQSSLYPIIVHFESVGIPIFGQSTTIARDIGANFVVMMFAFTNIAPPISQEFKSLIRHMHGKVKSISTLQASTSATERERILRESLIALDKVYVSKSTEIHSPPEKWDFKLGILRTEKKTIAVQMKLPFDAEKPFVDNIIDLVRPYLGNYGARVVHLLYEIANDEPYWRNPVITIDTNELLDRMGLKRDDRGIHRSGNRERLRDALNAAHNLVIIGEYTTWENGKRVRKAIRKTVLSLIGATFDADESANLSTLDLFERGLPKSMQIRLNFYDGIRRPDGTLGNQYVLMSRLAEPHKLLKANYSATHELLKAYLLFRYRQTQMKSRTITVTRQTALEKANITNKYAPGATVTLRRALDRLVAEGILESYSTPLPSRPYETFEAILSENAVYEPPVD